MRFAKIVFWVAFDLVGRNDPPPITHPGFFYGFVGVALAWQFAFVFIATDTARFRPLMIPCVSKKLVGALRSIESDNPELIEKIRTEADYFERNAERMRYPKFRRQHLFVGSGVIEAGCKTVIASRLKRSGMFWTVRGANAILALRCCHLNGEFEDYWEERRAA